jgi:hypothetical protein
LDIAAPEGDDRHIKLGRFMDAWSLLEGSLDRVLAVLLGMSHHDTGVILSALGMRQIIDLLESLAKRKLIEEDAATFVNLMDRLRRLNTKRNVLIHGHWVLEANVIVRRGEAVLVTQFLRELTPLDPAQAKAIGDPRNQRERVRWAFNFKRIEATERDTDTIGVDISAFVGKMRSKALHGPISEALQILAESQPYRITIKPG